jgi:Methane oxygenase PmoA
MKAASLLPVVFLLLAVSANAQVKVTPAQDRIAIEIDSQPFGELRFGPDVWKPYLWPLRSASGKIVVRQFPMVKDVAGEPRDHFHQRGLWWAHGDVNGFDFWSTDPLNKPNPKFGKIALAKIVGTKSGKNSGSLNVLFDWKDPDGKTILTENRSMTFGADPKLRIVDVDLTLTPQEKIVFGDTKEGTFGVRLAAALQENKGGHMVNAEGAEGEKSVWGKPSEWVDYYGTLEGEALGIAIFDHPQNPRHPVRWHSRAYGLFAANPFGLADFENDKSKNGAMTAEAGQALRFRYRVVIHAGDAKTAGIAGMYNNWTK